MPEENLEASSATPQERIDALNELAWAHNRTDLTKAFEYAEEAYHLAHSINYVAGIAGALGNLAQLQHYEGRNEVALDQVLKAVSLFEAIAQRGIPFLRALHTRATIYRMMGSYADALNTYLQLLEISEHAEDRYFQAMALNGIGTCYSDMGRPREALEYYQKCLPIFETIHYHLETAALYSNAAIEYSRMRNFPAALVHASTGLTIARDIHDPELEVVSLIILGEIYTDMGALTEATAHFQAVLEQIHTLPIHIQRYKLTALFYLGKILARQNRPDNAKDYYIQALALAEETGERAQMYRCHAQLAELYKQQGDFEKALLHYEAFHRVKESVYDETNTRKMNSLRVLHETDTARKEAEFYRMQNEMLEKLRDQDRRYFETMTRMRDDLLHAASHDLKHPLANIITSTYLLRRHLGEPAPQLERYLDRIDSQVDLMRRLITNLLDLAAIETRRTIAKLPVPLNEFLQSVVQDFELQAHEKHILLTFVPSMPEISIAINVELMQRVFQNLLSNAIKYTPEGGQVTVSLQDDEQHVHIRVTDTGIGIPEADLPYIFEKFYRVRHQQHMAAEGTGLGLPIAKEIVEQHGGTIHATSTPGAGSQFEVILPCN